MGNDFSFDSFLLDLVKEDREMLDAANRLLVFLNDKKVDDKKKIEYSTYLISEIIKKMNVRVSGMEQGIKEARELKKKFK